MRWVDFEIGGLGTCYTLLLEIEDNFRWSLSAFFFFFFFGEKNTLGRGLPNGTVG